MPSIQDQWVMLCPAGTVSPGEMKAFSVDGKKIALFRDEDGTHYATTNICTHEYALLTDGWLEDGEIECPLHSGRFCIRSGKALCKPAEADLPTYAVKVESDSVFVALPSED